MRGQDDVTELVVELSCTLGPWAAQIGLIGERVPPRPLAAGGRLTLNRLTHLFGADLGSKLPVGPPIHTIFGCEEKKIGIIQKSSSDPEKKIFREVNWRLPLCF